MLSGKVIKIKSRALSDGWFVRLAAVLPVAGLPAILLYSSCLGEESPLSRRNGDHVRIVWEKQVEHVTWLCDVPQGECWCVIGVFHGERACL